MLVRLDNVGDVIMLGPAVRALRHALPAAHLALLASPAGAQAAPLLPGLDEILSTRAVWQDASGAMPFDPARERALVDDLRAEAFDAAVIFTSFSQSPHAAAYLCYLAGIPIRLGQSKEFAGRVLSLWLRSGPDWLHQVDRNLALLEAAGFPAKGRQLEVHVDRATQAEADSLLLHAGIEPEDQFIVVAPMASCAARTYPLSRFADVIAALPDRTGRPVVVVGSARDEATLRNSVAANRGVTLLAGRTSIAQLAAILRRTALAVVNNSGPMHLADAFRRPMVVLYSGSEYTEQWRPRSSPAWLLTRATDCAPCYRFTCPYAMECLDFQPDAVLDACADMLRSSSSSKPPNRWAFPAAEVGGRHAMRERAQA